MSSTCWSPTTPQLLEGRGAAREASLFGNGLLLSEGEFWRGQRRIMQPAFHRRRVDQYAGIMTASTERMMAGWRDGATRDIHHDMMKLTLEIAVEVLFGADVHDRAHGLARAFAVVGKHFQVVYERIFFVPEWIPIPGNRRYRKALDWLDRWTARWTGSSGNGGSAAQAATTCSLCYWRPGTTTAGR